MGEAPLHLAMKILLIVLLCASLTANALLFVQTSRSHSDSPSASSRAPKLPASLSTPSIHSPAPVVSPDTLAQLQAGDSAAFQKLRELGFSEKVIRTLAQAQVDAQFRERERALQNRPKGPYWKSGYNSYNPGDYAAYVDLRRDKEAAMKKLLGNSYVPEASPRDGVQLANLSPEKAVRVRQIEEDYNAMASGNDNYSRYGTFIAFPEDTEKRAYLNKEKRAELSQILTPDELFEYDLRTSPTASSLRYQLAAFQPTEEEFREIYKLRQAAETRAGINPMEYTTGGMDARRAMENDLDEQIKAKLGDARFAEYKHANETDYRRFFQIASRLDLPKESVAAAQAVKTSIEDQRRQLMDDPAAKDPAVRAQRLDGLARSAEASLRRILGDEGYEAYRQSPSNFIQRLKPPARPNKG